MMDDKQRNSLVLAILLRQYSDFLDWEHEDRQAAVTALMNEALDAGLKGIMDTIQMLDDMAKQEGEQ